MEQTLATTTGGKPSPLDRTGLNLLSLDGGGVRGLSTLYILKRIMDQLNAERKKSSLEAVKPCDIFDLIGGTSTGGLIAIMLGRLEMDVDQCIDAYVKLACEVFSEGSLPVDWLGRVKSKFDSKKLKDAIYEIAKKGEASGDEPFNDGKERGCKTFVCTTERLMPGTVRLRSYSLENEQGISATIGEAALATSAAPAFFDPVSIGTRTFADGGLFANNPVDEVEGEASNIWCPETGDLKPLVKCFISLGTGVPDSKPFRTSAYKFLSETVVNISTETENTEKKFIARWAKHLDDKRYFRFNVQQGLQNVGLDEHEKLGTMDAATEAYLKHQEQKFRVRDCIQNMKLKQKRPESTPVPPKVVSTSTSPKSRQQLTMHHVFWIVPFERNPRFTGRDFNLTQLVEKLFAKDYTNKIAITGLGGVGKTQVAIELLFQMRERYPDCLTIWIPAARMESLHRAYTNTAEQLRITGWEDEKADVKRLVQQYLNKESRGQWLLVFDNADDINMWIAKAVSGLQPQQGPPPLLDYLPQSKQGAILFTTRDRKTAVKLAQQNVFELPAMEEEVAVQLLEKCLLKKHLILNRPDTDALLSQLTYLPLAIVQAASYINENGINLGEYLSLLAEQEEEVIELLSEEFEDDGRYRDMKNPVAITWLISFEQILRLYPLAAEYLSIMACVEPNDIPLSLLAPGSSRKRHIDAIGTLEAYSFISKKSDGQTLGLHRLVHLAMRNWLRQEQKLAESTEKAISRLEELFPDSTHKNRNIWRMYLTHVRCVLESDLVKKDWNTRLKLIHRYAMCLYEDGRWNEAELPFAQVVELKANLLEPNDPDMLKSKANLASTYRHQGRWAEAEKIVMEVLKARQRVLGPEHLDTLSSTSDLAWTYWDQGRWAEAETMNKKMIETRRRVLGGEHPDTLKSMANLGSTLRKRGRLQEAEDIDLEVMRTSRRVLGEEHPSTVASMANLASTYQLQERWSETENLETEVIQKRRRILGEHHPATLSSMANLALTYSKQGKWQESERRDEEVIKVREQILGDIHPDTLLSRANLASTYRRQGRWTEAEEIEVEVMAIRQRVLGDDHPSTLKSMNNLALTMKGQGRSVEAVQLMLECVRLANRRFGPDDPQTLASSATLAECQSTP